MVRKIVSLVSGLALGLAPHFHAAVYGQAPPAVELVSVGTDGMSGNHQSGSDGLLPARTRVSADGRYVAFESYASTIICQDNDFSTRDVFVRDRLTGTATLVSVAWDGSEANHDSLDPVISADGRYVAFESQATDLVPGDTNDFNDIFVRDLQAGTTQRVSVSSTGEQSNSVSHAAAISADGRYVVFYSGGSNLVPGDTNNNYDIFVRDVLAGTTERASVSTAGAESPCCASLYPSISADGRYVAFLSQGRLDPSVNNNWQEIYIRDRTAGTITLVRPAANGDLSSGGIRFADLSADGRFVAFMSGSTNIVVPDQNGGVNDVFLKDLVTGTTTLVSQATDGTWGNHDSWSPSISADGRYVAFHSWANNLVPGDTNTIGVYDIFLRDTLLGTTVRLNLTPAGGEADGTSLVASISADGSVVSFESSATNLGPPDLINGFQDVFVAGPPYPGAAGTSFQFETSSYSAAEAGGTATITVTRTGPLCTTATVQYATSDGSATAGTDYVAASGALTFLAGETTQTFDVTLLDDAQDEPDETVALGLSDPTGGPTLGDPSAATLTILDDGVPQNSPPNAVDDAAATNEDTPVAIDVLANDADPDGDPLAITAFTQGAQGSVAGNGDGTLTYTPAPNVFGGDAFTYTIDDGNGGTDTANVTVTVAAVNDPPVAVGETYGMGKDTTLTVAAPGVLGNDSDIDSPVLTAALVTGPANGALALNADGSFTYAPANGFVGTDAFTYQASDGGATSNTATVSIVVAGFVMAPVAGTTTPIPGGTGSFIAFPGGPLAGAGAVGFIGLGGGGQQGLYATLAGGQPLIRLADLATPIPGGSGAFTALREPSLAFQPGDPCHEAAFVGDGASGQQGIYAASFGDASCSGAPITVADLATPIPGGSGAFTALREPSLSFQPGDPCHEAAFVGEGASGQQGIYVASFGDTSCAGAPITVADLSTAIPGGSGAFTALREPSLSFQPGDPCHEAAFIGDGAGGQQGIYAMSFGDASCAGASIKVADSATSIPQGQGTFTGFLALSASGGHVAFLATGSSGQKGIYLASTLTKIVDLSDTIDGKTLADLRFGPGGLAGNQLAFAAAFTDGSEGVFQVTIDFPGTNDPPVANPDTFSADEDVALAVAVPGVLGNDSDVEGGALAAVLVSGPANGALALNADGSFTYTPSANFHGSDSFTYKAIDAGGAESNVATVSLTVHPADAVAPVVTATQSPAANGHGWHNADVTVALAAADEAGGTDVRAITFSVTGAQSIPPTQVAGASASFAVSAEGVTEISFYAEDHAGNVGAAQTLTIRLDKTPPVVSIDAPAEGASYSLNQSVLAAYACSDALSGVDACAGTVAAGSPLDTASVGAKTFTVEVADMSGNAARRTSSYSVRFLFIGFLRPVENWPIVNEARAGRTYPVKWQLTDASGAYVSELTSFASLLTSPIACDASPSAVLEEEAAPTGEATLRYDAAASQFIYNWQTERGWSGCRQLQLTLSDGTRHYAKLKF